MVTWPPAPRSAFGVEVRLLSQSPMARNSESLRGALRERERPSPAIRVVALSQAAFRIGSFVLGFGMLEPFAQIGQGDAALWMAFEIVGQGAQRNEELVAQFGA